MEPGTRVDGLSDGDSGRSAPSSRNVRALAAWCTPYTHDALSAPGVLALQENYRSTQALARAEPDTLGGTRATLPFSCRLFSSAASFSRPHPESVKRWQWDLLP
jgi:hypothetical protein